MALQYGHRESVDLDWFSTRKFSTETIIQALTKLGKFKLVNEEPGTVDGVLQGVKVSFFLYPYKLLRQPKRYHAAAIASVADIACMKINAVAGRNAKKDFFDLYFILQKEKWTLAQVLGWCDQKFGTAQRDPYHVWRSLVYFEEADAQPEIIVTPTVKWSAVKKFFEQEVQRLYATTL